mmetsp:Transcript_3899/g.9077  ORF Transcript_3899/g.9077 Transcript_3899/m.9077 type:complete len:121 (+) Transcript_3899:194-556(+)
MTIEASVPDLLVVTRSPAGVVVALAGALVVGSSELPLTKPVHLSELLQRFGHWRSRKAQKSEHVGITGLVTGTVNTQLIGTLVTKGTHTAGSGVVVDVIANVAVVEFEELDKLDSLDALL